jgi:hypothetical protein
MSHKPELPATVVEEIHSSADAYINSYPDEGTEWGAYVAGATAYAADRHQLQQENAELRHQNDKMKEQATGWRPLLEEVLKDNGLTAMYPDHFINKVKKFLYGE